MKNSSIPQSPYKGLQPYNEDDRHFFFGRERDREIIASNLFASSLTVFYGASGVGKSSVLLAGVVPIVRESPRVAVVVFRDWQDASFETALKLKVLKAIKVDQAIDLSLELDEFLLACTRVFRGSLFIILDQFEEYFLYHPLSPKAEEFDAAFARSINRSEIGANFLMSMRDDGLSRLDRFQKRIPNLLNNMLRLEHLDRTSAELAIRNPLTKYNERLTNGQKPVRIEDELVTVLLDDLQTGRVTLDITGQGKVSGDVPQEKTARIDTPFLQVVLTRLWDEEQQAAGPDDPVVSLRLSTYQKLGAAKSIVRTHLDKTMETDRLSPVRNMAAALFHFLVTPSGMKIAHTVNDLTSYVKAPKIEVEKALTELSQPDLRILRPIAPPPGQPELLRYEIFHDVLAPAILDWRLRVEKEHVESQARAEAERVVAEQRREAERQAMSRRLEQATALADAERKRAEAETQRAEIETRRAREQAQAAGRLKKLVSGLAVMVFLAVGLATLAAFSWQRANAQTERAQQEADRAKAAEAVADELRKKAEDESGKANEAKAETLKALNKTEVERRRAEEQAGIAERERKRAEDLQAYAEEQADKAKFAESQAKLARDNEALYRDALALARSAVTRELAVPKLNEVVQFYQRRDDRQAQISALLNLGQVHAEFDYEPHTTKADQSFGQAMALAQDEHQRAITEIRVGDVYRELPAWYYSRPRDKAIGFYQQAYERFQKFNDRRNQAATKIAIGLTLGDQAQASSYTLDERKVQYQRALDEILVGLSIYGELKDEPNQALAFWHLGETAQKSQEPELTTKAYDYYRSSLNLYRLLGDMQSVAFVRRRLVSLEEQNRNRTAALEGYEEVAKLYRDLRDPVTEAAAVDEYAFAFVHYHTDPSLPEAERSILKTKAPQVIRLIKETVRYPAIASNHLRRSSLLNSLARIYEAQQDFASALAAYQQVLEEYKRFSIAPRTEFYVLDSLTRLVLRIGDQQLVKKYLQESARVISQLPHPSEALAPTVALGGNALENGQEAMASELFNTAINKAREIATAPSSSPLLVANILREVGTEYSRRRRVEEGLRYFNEALEIFQKQNDGFSEANLNITIGQGYAAKANYLKAIEHFERALLVFQKLNYGPGQENSLRSISDSYGALGNNAKRDEYKLKADSIQQSGPPNRPKQTP